VHTGGWLKIATKKTESGGCRHRSGLGNIFLYQTRRQKRLQKIGHHWKNRTSSHLYYRTVNTTKKRAQATDIKPFASTKPDYPLGGKQELDEPAIGKAIGASSAHWAKKPHDCNFIRHAPGRASTGKAGDTEDATGSQQTAQEKNSEKKR